MVYFTSTLRLGYVTPLRGQRHLWRTIRADFSESAENMAALGEESHLIDYLQLKVQQSIERH